MSNTFPFLKKKSANQNTALECQPLLTEVPSALPVENRSNPCEPAQKMPSGTKPAVSETTNKVISFHWHSLPLCQKRKDELPHQLLATFAPPEVTSPLLIFSLWTLGKAYQRDPARPEVCALRNWRHDKCLQRREKISVFLSVIFSLEMFPETWKEGWAEEPIKLAPIKSESRREQPALSASTPGPTTQVTGITYHRNESWTRPVQPFTLSPGKEELFPVVSLLESGWILHHASGRECPRFPLGVLSTEENLVNTLRISLS